MVDRGVRTATAATGLNALSAILPQVFSLLLLPAAAYGRFSIVYLVYAAGASSVFSVICEAWGRTVDARAHEQARDDEWRRYSGALLGFSSMFGVVAGGVALLIDIGWVNAALGAVAVLTLVHRTGSRYFETHIGDWRHVVRGDVANVCGATAAFAVGLLLGWEPLTVALAAWAAGSTASVAGSRRPHLAGPAALRRWIASHRRMIRPLLADSLLLDAGAIGTPYLLAPILGLAPFGVYRAVSNVATPVQLTLNPLRPLVSASPRERLLSPRLLVPAAALLTAAGVACYLILVALPGLPFRLGVLSELYQVALPASLFVPANGLSFYIYLVARSHAAPARILQARVAQTILALVIPLSGALLGGLQGAVWGFTGSALAFVVIWWIAVTRGPRSSTDDPERRPRGS